MFSFKYWSSSSIHQVHELRPRMMYSGSEALLVFPRVHSLLPKSYLLRIEDSKLFSKASIHFQMLLHRITNNTTGLSGTE